MLCNDPSPVHPPLGTLIDDNSLELVEVLGVGGYGVVYRAEDTCSSSPKSYAVKCLLHRPSQSARQRQIHIREIALHQLASAHPNVITLHRVIEDYNCTYIIMDYAPDHDLFHQILHSCRYLGDDRLVMHVFLQILDAVEYCHSLGIYHRDLKPENVLCFDDGLRVAITDFGLATTDKVSEEFRTGSIYHMSPECQGGEFAPNGTYSPMFNDIWSLGIILLNLATGRNPWKSASASDPTFQAYLRDPLNFLPTVLPISPEVNAILVRMLDVDYRHRMTIPELRVALEEVDTFYSEGAIFEGSMARCPWEAGMEIDSDSSQTKQSPVKSQVAELKSHWSEESFESDIIFASHSVTDSPWVGYPPFSANHYTAEADDTDYQRIGMGEEQCELYARPQTPPSLQSPCASAESGASYPVTPNSFDLTFGGRAVLPQRKPLIIDTNCVRPSYYRGTPSLGSSSPGSSIMQTAVEYPTENYAAELFGASIQHPIAVAQSVRLGDSGYSEDKEMTSPTVCDPSAAQVSRISSESMYSSTKNSYTTTHISFDHRSSAPSPEPVDWSEVSSQFKDMPPESQPSLSLYMTNAADISLPLPLPPARPLSPAKRSLETKLKATLFTPLKFFPRHPHHNSSTREISAGSMVGAPPQSTALVQVQQPVPVPMEMGTKEFFAPLGHPPAVFEFEARHHTNYWTNILPPPPSANTKTSPIPISIPTTKSARKSSSAQQRPSSHHRPPTNIRHWFLPSKLFTSSFGSS
ncbi:hypothetical protein GYMLUDRAFT_64018 [Collybiopsis luxurians FD-317 M1]|uniref:Protein kinase domain-containing protein n=1 Tax=Collybiopsis luxurians FD-317 M1 TaxID=944289 RepID=A0A0D0ARA8_9AGAR|nr:hypothetical protein GYMLUDRAFT_64018 [Collybiopsis luxurians FD-317 M1]